LSARHRRSTIVRYRCAWERFGVERTLPPRKMPTKIASVHKRSRSTARAVRSIWPGCHEIDGPESSFAPRADPRFSRQLTRPHPVMGAVPRWSFVCNQTRGRFNVAADALQPSSSALPTPSSLLLQLPGHLIHLTLRRILVQHLPDHAVGYLGKVLLQDGARLQIGRPHRLVDQPVIGSHLHRGAALPIVPLSGRAVPAKQRDQQGRAGPRPRPPRSHPSPARLPP
jgi:hypothetical protein